ncbi:MAG: hypothetical protein ACOC7J_06585 [Armatimonadota bacterium]
MSRRDTRQHTAAENIVIALQWLVPASLVAGGLGVVYLGTFGVLLALPAIAACALFIGVALGERPGAILSCAAVIVFLMSVMAGIVAPLVLRSAGRTDGAPPATMDSSEENQRD